MIPVNGSNKITGKVYIMFSLLAQAPIDLAATGTTIAGYIAGAAAGGVSILAGLYGLRIIIRAFKTVK